jgi:hypothetical protein
MFRDGHHLYVNSHRDQFPHSERSVSNPHPAFGTPLPFKAKGEGDTSIVDCVPAIGYNVDLWTVFQTLIRVNLSAASTSRLMEAWMREQCDGPIASIDSPWSVRSLLLGLGHRSRYPLN